MNSGSFSFLVVKATTYKHVYMLPQFSLAYTRACACAYAFALVKSRSNAAKRLLYPAAQSLQELLSIKFLMEAN